MMGKIKYSITIIAIALTTFVRAGVPNWTVNSSNYQYSMNYTVATKIDGQLLQSDKVKIGAFVNGVCRGVTNLQYDSDYNKYIGYLWVYSNTPNETVSFKIYNPATDKVSSALKTVKFNINANIGGVINPFVLSPNVLSSKAEFLSYSFKGVNTVSTDIKEDKITVTVPIGTKLSSLTPVFTTSKEEKVYVGTNEQKSGVQVHDFSNPITHKIVSEDGTVLKTLEISVQFEKKITVTATANLSKIYTENDPVFTYTITGSNESPANLVEGKLSRKSGERAGKYEITQGTLKPKTGYSLVFKSNLFTIKPKPIKVIAKINQHKVYANANPVLQYTVTPELKRGDKLLGVLQREAGEDVGEYIINKGTLSSNDYTITSFVKSSFKITPKPITIKVEDNQKKVYGEVNPVYKYLTTPALKTGDKFTGVLSRTKGENVGNYAITQGTLSAGKNYAITFKSKNFGITKKPIKVTVVPNQKKVYGEEDVIFSYTVAPSLIQGDSFSGKLERKIGENVGDYAINQGSLLLSPNYNLSFVGSTYRITPKAVTVTVDANQRKEYSDKEPVLTYSVYPSLVKGDKFTGRLTRETGENVGTYAISDKNLSLGKNYKVTFKSDVFTINQKEVVVTVDSKQYKIYGVKDPELTYTYEPVLKEGNKLIGRLEREKGEEVKEYLITQGSLAVNTNNYKIKYESNYFRIVHGEVVVSADFQEKIYGEKDPEFTYKIVKGLPKGLENLISGELGRDEGEDVGKYTIRQGEFKIEGYFVDFVSSKLEIKKATQTIIWNQKLEFDCGTEAPIKLNATTNSKLPITYEVYNTAIADVKDGYLVFNKGGSTLIKAFQKGNKNYLPAKDVVLDVVGKVPNLLSRYSSNTVIFDNSSRKYVAWQWYKNGKLIPNAVKQYYTDKDLVGTYYVVAKNTEGQNEVTCDFEVVNTNTFVTNRIRLYPNPVRANEEFVLKVDYKSEALKSAVVTMYDIRGKELKKSFKVQQENKFEAPATSGIYIIKLQLGNGKQKSINLLVK